MSERSSTDPLDVVRGSLHTLLGELIDGPPQQDAYILNPGDAGLIRSLERLSAEAASTVPPSGGACIAAHVDHVTYGLSLLNRWSRGEPNPWASADWSASWKRSTVSEGEWAQLQRDLVTAAHAWLDAIRIPRVYSQIELNGVIASVAHAAYHLGAIRQINRSIRGPEETGT